MQTKAILVSAVLVSTMALAALAAPPRPGEWPQWRGPQRNGISPDTGLLKAWPAGGPALAWKAKGIGLGATGVSITGDKVFTTGDFDNSCHLIALNVADGKQAWATKMGPVYVDAKWL